MICWSETGDRGRRVVFITVLTGLVCIGGRGLVNFSSPSSGLAGLTGLTTTWCRTGTGTGGGGQTGALICWIIRPGLRLVVAGLLSCKQGGCLSPSC